MGLGAPADLFSVAALASALELLGIGPIYHMKHVAKSGHAKPWIQAYEIKYEDKRDAGSLDVEFFDGMLGEYAVNIIPLPRKARSAVLDAESRQYYLGMKGF